MLRVSQRVPAALAQRILSVRALSSSAAGRSAPPPSHLIHLSSAPLFKKILIANRGEIACRVARTARKMGIQSVAIYSEPDAQSKHVQMADEAHCVGPALARESYLNIDRILQVCRESGAEAVHPGYGFLSENFEFCRRLEEAGITFIGPKVRAMREMGLKIESKLLAKKLGVNVVPGFIGELADENDAVRVAREIGYPVMIKASAGGGGKGMRIAWNDAEAREGFRFSRAEAKASFASDTVFLEKYIEEPRHIEVQIIGDSFGNCVYLNERECSIQRRNQKVIEEAPSSFLDAATRKAMGEQAVTLAKAVEYQSAGTVEFMVDKHRHFYFLEMNTRLQVEHPITEYITGIDIVQKMIEVAAGRPLGLNQSDIGIHGWAFESRVYAEDPLRNFMPSIGRLSQYVEPLQAGNADIRCDSGILPGSEISMHYDPMICKLVTHGPTRVEALQTMRDALDRYVIRGVNHNISFLRSVCDNIRFIAGDTTTAFIEQEYPGGFQIPKLTESGREAVLCAAVVARAADLEQRAQVSGRSDLAHEMAEARLNGVAALVVELEETKYEVFVTAIREEGASSDERQHSSSARVAKRGVVLEYDVELVGTRRTPADAAPDADDGALSRVKLTVRSGFRAGEPFIEVFGTPGGRCTIQMLSNGAETPFGYVFQYLGCRVPVVVRTPREDALFAHMPFVEKVDMSKFVVSPMPGSVISLEVKEGQAVVAGAPVACLEAMKMQNMLRAERDGIIKKIHVKVGETVHADQVLIEFAM